MKPRVAIWAAVSSKPQAAEGKESLREQERAGREYAEKVGGEVVAVYEVPGHTRDVWHWDVAERAMPAYRDLRRDAEADAFDTLWALDADRLGRDPALSRQVVSLVVKSGHALWVELGGYLIDDDATAAEYLFGIQSVRAREDQKRRVYHHGFGMKARVERGLPANNWPYGLQGVRDRDGKVVAGDFVPGEIEAVGMATDLYLAGQGYTRIAIALSDSPWRPRGGGRWTYQAVRKMLLSDVYAGYVRCGEHRNAEPSDKFPALWDEVTHKAVRRERARRKRGGSPPASPVSGVVFCRRCKRPMPSALCTWKMRHPYRFFRCGTHLQRKRFGVDGCHPNHVKESAILDVLEQAIAKTLRRPGGIDAVLAAASPGRGKLERAIKDARAWITDVEARQDRLARMVASGVLDEASVRRVSAEFAGEHDRALAAQADAQAALALAPDPEEMRGRLEELAAHLLRGMPMEEARALLRGAGVRAWVEDGEVVQVDFCAVG